MISVPVMPRLLEPELKHFHHSWNFLLVLMIIGVLVGLLLPAASTAPARQPAGSSAQITWGRSAWPCNSTWQVTPCCLREL